MIFDRRSVLRILSIRTNWLRYEKVLFYAILNMFVTLYSVGAGRKLGIDKRS